MDVGLWVGVWVGVWVGGRGFIWPALGCEQTENSGGGGSSGPNAWAFIAAECVRQRRSNWEEINEKDLCFFSFLSAGSDFNS